MNYPEITQNITHALAEDIQTGDITAQLISPSTRLKTELLLRENARLCGCDWFEQSFRQLAAKTDSKIELEWLAKDGDQLEAGTVVCRLEGNARTILSAERTALNFLQTLSGTATITANYVQQIADTNCRLLDTRKTIPALRYGQKYAVKCGGGFNHRFGLYDAYLIKENHLAACGGIDATVTRAREFTPEQFIQVEVENLDQLRQAISAKVDRVLLDNFDLPLLKRAIEINQNQIELEASGDITMQNIRQIALTGVDFISIGSLTKHVRAIDFSLRFCD